jgi:hypothetical protein
MNVCSSRDLVALGREPLLELPSRLNGTTWCRSARQTGSYPATGTAVGAPLGVEPLRNLNRVEAQKVAPLDERNSSLGDEPADVPGANSEMERNGRQVDQLGQCRLRYGLGHDGLLDGVAVTSALCYLAVDSANRDKEIPSANA